jgi:hypothetical protein
LSEPPDLETCLLTCVLAAVALQVLQEVVDDRHWDDVADVLTAGQALEGNAHLQKTASGAQQSEVNNSMQSNNDASVQRQRLPESSR